MSVHPELFQLDANTPTFSGSAFAPLYLQCLLFDKGDHTSRGKSHFSLFPLFPPLAVLLCQCFQGGQRRARRPQNSVVWREVPCAVKELDVHQKQ